MEETDFRYHNDEIDLLLLARKMLSYKALLAVVVFVGILISLVWGLLLYSPSYDFSASHSFTVATSSTYSNMYGVHYILPEELVARMNHLDTASAFLFEKGIDEKKLSAESFLKNIEIKYEKGALIVNGKGSEELVSLYQEYLSYCVDFFNDEYRSVVMKELMAAKESISEELNEVQSKVFDNENLNSSNYSYSITLSDRIKSIDIQIKAIEEGAMKVYSDYEVVKSSSRGKTMVIIVLAAFVVGAIIDFLICFLDPRIYFSDDITNTPTIKKRIISSIPLYKNGISIKESTNIRSKLPDGTTNVSVSEISPDSGAVQISKGLKSVASGLEVEYAGCLVKDGDILSSFSKYDANLIVLRAGIDDINQVRNIVNGCRIKGVDNYYFVLNGLMPTDKMVTLFEDKSHYVKYPFYSFRTLRQHYEHYYKKD